MADFSRLSYQDPNLYLAALHVRRYEAEKDRLDFYHVMIRCIAFTTVIRALEHGNVITFLPFSCLCNGGSEKDMAFRVHRHMIVVVPKGMFFGSFWNKIILHPRTDRRPYKLYERIQSTWQLIQIIGSLGQETSHCHFTLRHKETEEKNHLFVDIPLPKEFRLVLALEYDGGIMDLLNWKYSPVNPTEFFCLPLQCRNGLWQLKIKYLPDMLLDFILPVSQCFKPTKDPTDYYVCLNHGQRFYFEMDPEMEKLDKKSWRQKQQDCGNLFYSVMVEEYWPLTPYQQKFINDVQPFWELEKKLAKENAQLKKEMLELKQFLLMKGSEGIPNKFFKTTKT